MLILALGIVIATVLWFGGHWILAMLVLFFFGKGGSKH